MLFQTFYIRNRSLYPTGGQGHPVGRFSSASFTIFHYQGKLGSCATRSGDEITQLFNKRSLQTNSVRYQSFERTDSDTSSNLTMQIQNIPDISKEDSSQMARPLSFGSSIVTPKSKGMQVALRERFIQRLIVDGKKSIATKIFDESLELLKERIQQYNLSTDTRGKSENLYSLATLTKDEIFIIALRKAQP